MRRRFFKDAVSEVPVRPSSTMIAPSRPIEILAPLSGILVPLDRVPDPVFAQRTVGDGISIDPTSCELLSPVAGVVTLLHRARHALTITTAEGLELLVHIGVDTVALKGAGFAARVRQGERVEARQPLISFEADRIARSAPSLLTQVLIANRERIRRMSTASGLVDAGRSVILTLDLAGSGPADQLQPEGTTALSDEVRLPNPQGLHARPAALLAAAARAFRSDVRLLRGGESANAKSLTSILLLATQANDALRVSASGPDANEAVRAIATLLASGAGETQPGAQHAASPAATDAPAAAIRVPGAFAPRADASSPARVATADPRKLTGISASPGLALGRVAQLRRATISVAKQGGAPERERAHFEAALADARRQITAEKAAHSALASQILAAHLELLADPELLDLTVAGLAAGYSAGYAWQEAFTRYAGRLEALASPLLRERGGDVRDVGARVLRLIAGTTATKVEVEPGSILIGDELTPSEAASLDASRVLGLCTTGGGPTGHAAILARALGIPAVCGADRAVRELDDGTIVLLDGTAGTLQRNPTAGEIADAQAQIERVATRQRAERVAAAAPAITTDGHRIEIAANIGAADEAAAAVAQGAEGVGLLRSEFLFLGRDAPPTEEEQAELYCAVAGALGRTRRLVIRTLDVGGDKPLPFLPLPQEDNPFLGVRGIRASLVHPQLLRAQLRAILRAAPLSDVHVMFPMIATLDELRAARRFLDEERGGRTVRVGVMVEVPSAALTAERLAAEVDFFSVGTNDLTQYTLAMDRGHPQLAAQADALHPAVLRLIRMTAQAAHARGKWVGVCGGLAAEPLAVPLLLGLGIDELSMPVPAIPAVKGLVRRLSLRQCQELAQQVSEFGTAGEVRARLAEFVA